MGVENLKCDACFKKINILKETGECQITLKQRNNKTFYKKDYCSKCWNSLIYHHQLELQCEWQKNRKF